LVEPFCAWILQDPSMEKYESSGLQLCKFVICEENWKEMIVVVVVVVVVRRAGSGLRMKTTTTKR